MSDIPGGWVPKLYLSDNDDGKLPYFLRNDVVVRNVELSRENLKLKARIAELEAGKVCKWRVYHSESQFRAYSTSCGRTMMEIISLWTPASYCQYCGGKIEVVP